MDRQYILSTFKIDQEGIIRSPGRFEGERLYVPYFWDAYLQGLADRDDGKIFGFDITEQDRREFPELKGKRAITFYQRDDGFIIEC